MYLVRMKTLVLLACLIFTNVVSATAFPATIQIFCMDRGELSAKLIHDGYEKKNSFFGDLIEIPAKFTWFANLRERILVSDDNYFECAILRVKEFI